MQNDYFGFIAAAYGISALLLAGLALWIVLDARAQRRALAGLEEKGVRRRSSARPETSS
ncbi:heme exporter protein CcmD [Aurantimonas aggregata]|uniref:Heme exporter protein D n=1 Tax=Aurantimonas aggregata TaxID=2047720 RepID=A0A6L9MI15_9HYPH|nr:heme exporter protein CcmD [Aurantimonas aggregata]NDV87493.1 heme exporter protein CcmD [Aurantimonas aggregata]